MLTWDIVRMSFGDFETGGKDSMMEKKKKDDDSGRRSFVLQAQRGTLGADRLAKTLFDTVCGINMHRSGPQ